MDLHKKTQATTNNLNNESAHTLSHAALLLKRKVLPATLIAALIISITGCGNSSANSSEGAAASSEAGSIGTSGSGSSENASDNSTSSADNSNSDAANLDYTDIVDEHLAIYLDFDSYGVQFDLALEAISDYLDGTASLDDTLSEIESVQNTLSDYYSSLEDYTVSDELSDVMLEYDVPPEEFEYFAELRAYQVEEYISDLDIACSYLEHADEYEFEHEEVAFWYQIHSTIQDAYRGYYYYGSVNYWFAEWEEEPANYVQETVIPQIQCYLPDNWVWETSQTAAENKTMSYLDLVEECVELSAKHLGNTNETIRELQAAMEELEELVAEAGLD